MDFLTSGFNLLLIILGFGVLIFIHELGHFIAAKWAGIRTEAFAVGMGPVVVSWRKGIGLRFGSTAPEYERRVRAFLESDGVQEPATTQAKLYRVGDKLGLGETEYSLRWLPIGGFVKMLGQEDANPNAVSDDPRSYNMRPVGKRMVVVSAGVIMNLILAVVLFIIAFSAGVKFEAPVVGDVSQSLPAGRVMPANAAALGIDEPGLRPGDVVTHIDGKPAVQFSDLQIASAMSRPGAALELIVRRAGFDQPLEFNIEPEHDAVSGLRSIGIMPGASTKLLDRDEGDVVSTILRRAGLADAGVKVGMRLLRVNGEPVTAYGQVDEAADRAQGAALRTEWSAVDENGDPVGPVIQATIETEPAMGAFPQRARGAAAGDVGVLGLSPLVRFARVLESSPNRGTLRDGDVLLRLDDVTYPRPSQLHEALKERAGERIAVVVLRDGEEVALTCAVNRRGKVVAEIEAADDVMITAHPINTYARRRGDDPRKLEDVVTPIQRANLFGGGGTRIESINGRPIRTWDELGEQVRSATAQADERDGGATIQLGIVHPTPGRERETIELALSADEVRELHALGWSTGLASFIFEPIQVTRSAGGNPITAVRMGFEETYKIVIMTYLTIDRLIRGTVGVEQLRGPVGIIHIGTKVADRGLLYLIFLLGMISVNLAVINFLPLPIVDGGLFLFLVYEKFKGRPPPLGFQNAATIVGLGLIITAFIVVTWNDVVRLLG